MSEIESKKTLVRASGKRSHRKSTRVDLTPMVDLGFLLITFFVFTTTLSQPTVMNLNMPFDKDGPHDKICESCVITLLLQKDNQIQYYEGMPGNNPIIKQTSFSPDGIRSILLRKKREVSKLNDANNDIVLIIKSSNESTFQNFVDIVDEVAINKIRHYYIADVDDTDKKLFAINQ